MQEIALRKTVHTVQLEPVETCWVVMQMGSQDGDPSQSGHRLSFENSPNWSQMSER